MAKTTRKRAQSGESTAETVMDVEVELHEPGVTQSTTEQPWRNGASWQRGLFMLIFMFLWGFGATVLGVLGIIQFFWLLFSGAHNVEIARIGARVADWLGDVARFQTGVSEDKPFPWRAL